MRGRHFQTLIALVLAGFWGLGVYFAHEDGHLRFLDRVESAMTDLRTLVRGVRVPPDPVTIVAIDDALVKQSGSYPIARGDLARIVDAIAKLAPKVIAIDLLLVDRGTDDGDDALAKSLAGRRTAIAAAAVFPESRQSIAAQNDGPLARLPRAEKFLLPLQKFADHAEIGMVNVATDRGGVPRSIPLLFRTSDRVEMSFPLRVAALAIGKEPTIEPNRLVLGERSVATDADHALPISFYGPSRTIRTLGAASVLSGEVAPDAIRNRIVVVGSTVTGGGDFFPTPFDPVMSGVEVIATAITHLMAGDGILRDQAVRFADGVIAVMLPMILVGLLAWRRSAVGLIAAGAVVLIWAAANFFAFSEGIWLSTAVPVAAAAPAAILFAAVQLSSGRRRAQYFAMRSELLEQFQAPGIQQWLTKDPNFLLEPVRQSAAVVFIDLSGFTSLSERLGPDAIRELLKNFHALVDREAVACGGTITSFLGDGAMILFGLPEAAADDAFRAAECSVGLCVSAEQWLTSLAPSIASRLGFKVGAHSGEIVASRLGGGSYQRITATGDTVNVASRLMEVAANHGVELAASNELLRAAGRDCAPYKSGVLTGPRETRIRGRSAPLAVWLWRSDLAAQGGEGLSTW
ncbi:adenylate/guanylate cyclase domain-containing protein [Bradyrhizobium sp.]|jgi:adenylate cyclase|uniref:CHASE2 domain-containing protein n=1 Tax=Bradyrhizobium sp. TaxID=376 RepID=UPI002E0883AE|nr:adenylate/guanylate cyclase domain-containing protein [Bradyrhizobium sp.]